VDPAGAGCSVGCGQQVGPDEEIRAAEEGWPVAGFGPGERALIDELDAGPEGFRGRLGRLGVRGRADVRDHASVRPELVEHRSLMSFAAPHQVLEADVELARRAQRALGHLQVQPAEVLAGEVVGDVARRQPQAAVSDLHLRPLVSRSAPGTRA